MALPKIDAPIHQLELPTTGETVRFRPFLVKEEKILLMAAESQESSEMIDAIKQVINNCMLDDRDVDQMATIDLEYFFIQLRSKSVGDKIKATARHKNSECKTETPIMINLDAVKVETKEGHTNKIDLGNNIGIQLKYPDFKMITKPERISSNDVEKFFELVADSIDNIWEGDQVYLASEQTRQELVEFLESLSNEHFIKVQEFFTGLPTLVYRTKFKCKDCGEEEEVEIRGLSSFFM